MSSTQTPGYKTHIPNHQASQYLNSAYVQSQFPQYVDTGSSRSYAWRASVDDGKWPHHASQVLMLG